MHASYRQPLASTVCAHMLLQEQMLQYKGTIRELERSLSEFQRSTLSQVNACNEVAASAL